MEDYLDRLMAMTAPGQQTWDLSNNDVRSIQWAVQEIAALRRGLAEAQELAGRAAKDVISYRMLRDEKERELTHARTERDAARAEAGRLRERERRLRNEVEQVYKDLKNDGSRGVGLARAMLGAAIARHDAALDAPAADATPSQDVGFFVIDGRWFTKQDGVWRVYDM